MFSYNSTAQEIKNAEINTAVLPIGSVEQHGPHLPVGTDFLIAGEIAAAISNRIGALLLPALPISTCREHKGGCGSFWMNSDTFFHVLKDISESMRVQGLSRLVLVIAHGGVFIAGPATREINSDNTGIKLIRVDLVNYLSSVEMQQILQCKNNLHACEYETSLMLYLHEELVKKEKIEDFIPDVPRDYLNYGTIPGFCKNGVWGAPSLASKEKGQKIFELLVEKSVEYIADVNRLFLKDM